MGVCTSLKGSWRLIFGICTPILLSPLIFKSDTQESKCAFMLCLCATFFVTEILPLSVTSLLPLALSPLLGLMSSKDACKVFFSDIIFLMLGGLIVAQAIEESNLHRRFALKLLMLIGVQPKRLLMTMMGATAFMSMWISNTASFSMMITITRALLRTMLDARASLKVDSMEEETMLDARASLKVDSMEEEILELDTKKEDDDHQDGCPAKLSPLDKETYNGAIQGEVEEKERFLSLDKETYNGATQGELEEKERFLSLDKETYNGATQGTKEEEKNELLPMEEDISMKEQIDEEADTTKIRKEEEKKDEKDGERKEEFSFQNYDKNSQKQIHYFCLGVCYAANIGGIATLTGTPTNLIVAQMADKLAADDVISPLTFATWASYGMPMALLTLVICFFWICLMTFGFKNTFCGARLINQEEDRLMMQLVVKSYRKLGSVSFAEKVVMLHFLVLVILWLTRKLGTNPGWAALMEDGYASDGMAAMAVGTSLFVWPRERPNMLFFRRRSDTSAPRVTPALMTWKKTSAQFPWGLIFLIGGGMVLATVTRDSGLSQKIAESLSFLTAYPTWVTTVVLTTLTCFATEITTNTVVAMLLMPVVTEMALLAGVHPLLYMMPVGVAASFAFMLPVATPPNALLYAYGDVTITMFMKTGFAINILGIIIASICVNTLGYVIFSFEDFKGGYNVTTRHDLINDLTANATPTSSSFFEEINMTSVFG